MTTRRFVARLLAGVSGALLVIALIFIVRAVVANVDADAAHVSTMKSDLRALVDAEQAFKRDSGRYSAEPPPGFHLRPDVRSLRIVPTSDGWYASVAHTRVMRVCIVYVGTTAFPPATKEGEPACTGTSAGITDPSFLPWVVVFLIFAAMFGGAAKWLKRPQPSTST